MKNNSTGYPERTNNAIEFLNLQNNDAFQKNLSLAVKCRSSLDYYFGSTEYGSALWEAINSGDGATSALQGFKRQS